MTPREKVLSIGVGVAIAVAAGSYLMTSIRKGFQTKNNRIDQLQSELIQRDTQITDGLIDRQKLMALALRSLPTENQRAQADYTQWLIGLVEESGLTSPKWSFINRELQERGVYKLFKFQVSGGGTIENATKLLYQFYAKDYLHRVTSLKISPVANAPYQLNIELSGEVLALEAASSKQAPPSWTSHRVQRSLDDYSDIILGRNLFSPANHPPQWTSVASTQAVRGSRFSFTPEAKDIDPGQRVRYEVVGDMVPGMRLSTSGEIDWMPEANGRYDVELMAIDSGIPQQKIAHKLTVEVIDPPPPVDPPKPPPQFDIASQAKLSGLVTGKDGPEAWVRSMLEGKTLYLKIGSKLTLGSVEGTVVSVGANYMELETEGKRWTVGLDENLADAYRRMNVD